MLIEALEHLDEDEHDERDDDDEEHAKHAKHDGPPRLDDTPKLTQELFNSHLIFSSMSL